MGESIPSKRHKQGSQAQSGEQLSCTSDAASRTAQDLHGQEIGEEEQTGLFRYGQGRDDKALGCQESVPELDTAPVRKSKIEP
jgi:hypothetical protein